MGKERPTGPKSGDRQESQEKGRSGQGSRPSGQGDPPKGKDKSKNKDKKKQIVYLAINLKSKMRLIANFNSN